MNKSLLILGMGPGLSLAVAERFGREGFAVGMISRTQTKLQDYTEHLSRLGIRSFYAIADLADTEQMLQAMRQINSEMRGVDVLMYNAVDYRMKHIMQETIEDLANGFKVSVGNALVAVQELLPQLEKSKGAVLLTGGNAANVPDANMGTISLGKAGIKNLAYQLHQTLSGKGVFVGIITIAGWINPESKTHAPKLIAEKFWEMHQQCKQVETVY